MAKPLEEWTPDELRTEIVRLTEELARASAARVRRRAGAEGRASTSRASCENWVRGLAWDETFTQEMVEDELSIHERKAGQELGPLERERLIQLWLDAYAERYRAALTLSAAARVLLRLLEAPAHLPVRRLGRDAERPAAPASRAARAAPRG